MASFSHNILPFVNVELALAQQARLVGASKLEFSKLENAHVLAQESTYLHTKVHCLMLLWALRCGRYGELFGQLLRIVGALTKTAVGLVPIGNTGGSNISPFKTLPLSPQHAAIIANAKRKRR